LAHLFKCLRTEIAQNPFGFRVTISQEKQKTKDKHPGPMNPCGTMDIHLCTFTKYLFQLLVSFFIEIRFAYNKRKIRGLTGGSCVVATPKPWSSPLSPFDFAQDKPWP
jgi:hypothetical protein